MDVLKRSITSCNVQFGSALPNQPQRPQRPLSPLLQVLALALDPPLALVRALTLNVLEPFASVQSL